ncbi:hypothetical protein JY97_07125 [Alkalispirochaeta odontotermitis]|nr:hypothetical protein JY97_07125 [Alkalispirochaeta odontotermitis]CAB1078701.1 hypothetical protein D1AOALGA4SA_6435 [Olavius algarvensis Delta 1 endosymbiont]
MRWKWILGIAAAVVAVLIVTVYIIIASYDFNKFKPRVADLARQYTGRELTLGGDIELGLSLLPTLVVNDVTFQNAAWGSRPEMARVKRLEVQVDLISILRGDINVNRLTVVKPEFLIEIDKSGKSNLDFDAPQKPGPQKGEDKTTGGQYDFLKFGEVRIEGAAVTYNDHQNGRTEAISIETLVLNSPDFGAAIAIDLKFTYQKIPFQINGSLGRISGILNPQEQWPLDLTITAVDSTVSIAGHITNIMEVKGIDLKLDAKGSDIAGFQQFSGEPLPVKGPFSVAARLDAPALDDFRISDITILLGESRISGEMALNRKAARPRIHAKFQSPNLDLRPFLKQDSNDGNGRQTASATGKQDTQSDKVFSAEPFDLQALQQLDAVVSLRADQILTHRLALEKFILDLSLKNGHLIVKPLTTDSGGGKVSCKLDLRTEKNQADLTTAITVEKIDLGEMLSKLGIAHDLDGVLDVTINLKGRGDSVAGLMAGLDGDVVAVLTEARMPVKYLNLVGADLTTSLLKIVNPFEKKIERAQINCAVCDFNIKAGLAQSDIIMIDDPDKTLYSAGTVNLKTEALDFGIETQPKEGLGTQETGKVSVSLSAITKPFKLRGTLANPSLGISPEGAAKTVASAIFRPGGVASLFVTTSSGKQDPCAAALEIAGAGPAKSTKKASQNKEKEDTGDKKKEGLGSRLKKLFSNPKD